jgi:hypothetical protein
VSVAMPCDQSPDAGFTDDGDEPNCRYARDPRGASKQLSA